MNFLKFLCISLLLSSCINEDSLKPVVPEYLIHNNTSKIWLLHKIEAENSILEPILKENTTTYTFFKDHDFYVQQLIHLGSHEGTKGSYNLSFKDNNVPYLTLYLPDASQKEFEVILFNTDELHLSLKRENNIEEQWFFKSYPKPF